MKFYWTMPAGLEIHYRHELEKYEKELLNGNLQKSWRQLERAHIIGQGWFKQHTYVHWLMLRFGIKIKNRREILGQIPRLLLGGVKSFVGKILSVIREEQMCRACYPWRFLMIYKRC